MILAFEADPDTFAVLSRNLSGQDVMLFHRAAASVPGTIDFYSSDTSGWSSRFPVLGAANARKVSVRAEPLSATLKAMSLNRIDFLKVDVEGAEYDILLGDKPLWDIKIGALVVEVDRTPRDTRYAMRDLVDFLKARFQLVNVGTGHFPLVTCRHPTDRVPRSE